MNRIAIVFFVVLLSVTSAWSRYYATVAVGSSANTDYDVLSTTIPLEKENNYTSYKLGVGYDQLITDHIYIGAELSYNNYGYEEYKYISPGQLSDDMVAQALNYDAVKMVYSSYDVMGKVGWQFNDKWRSYGQLGVAYEVIDATEDVLGIDLGENQWIPEIGVGVQYDCSEHVALTASFSYLMGQVSNIDEMPDITVGWFGVKYYF